MKGEGPVAEQMQQLFKIYCNKLGFKKEPELSCEHFQRPPQAGDQLVLDV
jgi:hypothetical protein